MKKPIFKKGDIVLFLYDGMKYEVRYITNESGSEPGERMYVLFLAGRWPWQSRRAVTLPESAAEQLLAASSL